MMSDNVTTYCSEPSTFSNYRNYSFLKLNSVLRHRRPVVVVCVQNIVQVEKRVFINT